MRLFSLVRRFYVHLSIVRFPSYSISTVMFQEVEYLSLKKTTILHYFYVLSKERCYLTSPIQLLGLRTSLIQP